MDPWRSDPRSPARPLGSGEGLTRMAPSRTSRRPVSDAAVDELPGREQIVRVRTTMPAARTDHGRA